MKILIILKFTSFVKKATSVPEIFWFFIDFKVWLKLCCGTKIFFHIINPRRACAPRVTVVGSVCVSVCLLSHISPTERLFILKTLSRTQQATKVKNFVGICLKRLCSRVMLQNMSEKANMIIFPTYPRSAFSAWHTAKRQRVPNDCQQHSALPKTMPTDAASLCWSENWQHHAFQLQREAWPISVHTHWVVNRLDSR